jgi:hypothetical protein
MDYAATSSPSKYMLTCSSPSTLLRVLSWRRGCTGLCGCTWRAGLVTSLVRGGGGEQPGGVGVEEYA